MATTKKIKKVAAPIDERETFVSLQKSFADSESSTEEKLKILYAVLIWYLLLVDLVEVLVLVLLL